MMGNNTRAILPHRLLGSEQYLLFTSELANQRAQKAPFTCVVYTKSLYSPQDNDILLML